VTSAVRAARRDAAALDLCSALGPGKKRHRLQRGAGHDDLFGGPTWAAEIYPLIREVIRTSGQR
jgi:poly(3-hydroxybutyrate) depolymerase